MDVLPIVWITMSGVISLLIVVASILNYLRLRKLTKNGVVYGVRIKATGMNHGFGVGGTHDLEFGGGMVVGGVEFTGAQAGADLPDVIGGTTITTTCCGDGGAPSSGCDGGACSGPASAPAC